MDVRENQRFYQSRPLPPALFENYKLTGCTFEGCYLPSSNKPGQWSDLRHLNISDSIQTNCAISTAKIEDVRLHNLRRHGDSPLFFWGCVFSRVTLSGRLSGLKINRSATLPENDALQSMWDAEVRAYYDSSDWALDISDAKFAGGVSFEAVPGDKIRRDSETQILVRRERLVDSPWRAFDFDKTAIDLELSWFLADSQFNSVVIAARMASKFAKRDLAILRMLREQGIADPD